jgi:hypothetical protein
MPSPHRCRRRRFAPFLLAAALVYLLGGAAGPWLHAHVPAAQQLTLEQRSVPPQAPAKDAVCTFCLVFTAPLLPAPEPAAPSVTAPVAADAPRAADAALTAAPFLAHPARAPPHG